MPFAIYQKLCLGCGSCIGNCPNRAIIRRGERVIITDMCSDCGACLSLCAIRDIGRGSIRAELDSGKLDEALKKKLGLTKNIAVLKFYDEPPEGVPREKGPHFWCGMCGDVFDSQEKPLFFTSEAGRMFMRLAHDKLLICFPFSLIPGLVKNLDRTVFAQE